MAMAKEIMGGGLSAGAASAMGGVYTAFTAAGSAQTDATAVGASMTVVASADGTKGVILTGQVGDEIWIFNNSGSTLKVYPPTGAAIAVPGTGLGSANAAYSHTTYAVCCYKCVTGTQWFVIKSA